MTLAQEELAEFMSDISEDTWCAGWLSGLEFSLWAAVLEGPREFGMGLLDADQIAKLKSLSEACGGWIYWSEDRKPGHNGPTFAPLDTWLTMYAAEMERLAKRAV